MNADTLLVFEPPSAGWWVLAALISAAGLVLAGRGLARSSPRRRMSLLVLRGLAFAWLFFLLLQPAWEHRSLRPLRGRLAVLVDESESMSLPEGENTRIERVRRFLDGQRASLAQLSIRADVEGFRFGERLSAVPLEDLARTASGARTDIVGALQQLAAQSTSQRPLIGVVVISDGADNELLGRHPPGQALPEAAREAVRALNAPLSAYGVGAEGGTDLAVREARADDFAFVRNAVSIEVEVAYSGPGPVEVPLVLSDAGRTLAATRVALSGPEGRRVKLSFFPDQVGQRVLEAAVPALPGERRTDNNRRRLLLNVIRDKLRVLHVVGRPSWDVRFLREALRQNPNVDLISFYILRTPQDAPGVSEDELSLIPFPVEKLFDSELRGFDVVIFQNFDYLPYQVGFFLDGIARYVEEGGALWMLGGELSFGAGGYAHTPLADVLPVKLGDGDDREVQEFSAQITAAGRSHPITERIPWEALPPLGSYHRTRGLAADAVALLGHPFEAVAGRSAPLLAVRQVSRGRSAVLLTDSLWRWRFWHVGRGGSAEPYSRLVHQLLRWLIRDPGMEPVELVADPARGRPGQPVRLSLRARGAPAGSRVQVEILDEAQRVVHRADAVLDESGRAEVTWPAPASGAFQARARVDAAAGSPLGATAAVIVDEAGPERARPEPRPDILRELAEAGGGRFGDLGETDLTDVALRAQPLFRVEASTRVIWLEQFWPAGLLALLWFGEWWLRRRWGFA